MKQETMGKKSIVDKMPSWDKNKYSSWRDWAADCYKAGQTSNESHPKDESKEVKEGGELFTGELFVDFGDFDRTKSPDEIYLRMEVKEDGGRECFDICSFACDETGAAKENAKLICEAINNYKAIRDSNAELKKALEYALESINNPHLCVGNTRTKRVIEEALGLR